MHVYIHLYVCVCILCVCVLCVFFSFFFLWGGGGGGGGGSKKATELTLMHANEQTRLTKPEPPQRLTVEVLSPPK